MIAAAFVLSGQPSFAQPQLEGGTDHFKCYETIEGTANAPITISLTDQFGTLSNVQAMTALELCNPVQKTVFVDGQPVVTPIEEEEAHLTFYELTQRLRGRVRTVVVDNQFGEQTLRLGAPRLVAVPTVKNDVGTLRGVESDLSHFTCYEASGKRLLVGAILNDQFHEEDVLIHAPQFFCNPAAKTRAGTTTAIARDEDHLVCYKITPSEAPPQAVSTVTAENQFERDTMKVGPSHFLCVPSEKVSFR